MGGGSDAFTALVVVFGLIAAVLAGVLIGGRWHRNTFVSMVNYTDSPQTIVMSPTAAWEKDKGLLILGPEYEIRIFDRRTGREAFK